MMDVVLYLIAAIYVVFIAQLIYGFNKVNPFERTEVNPKLPSLSSFRLEMKRRICQNF